MFNVHEPPRTTGAPLPCDLKAWLGNAQHDPSLIYQLTPDDLDHRITVYRGAGMERLPLGVAKVRRFAQSDTAATTRTWLKAMVSTCVGRKQYVWPVLRKTHLLTVLDHLGSGVLYLYHQENRASFQVRVDALLTRHTCHTLLEGMLVYFPDLSAPKREPKMIPAELGGEVTS